jgi:hypothetical protein
MCSPSRSPPRWAPTSPSDGPAWWQAQLLGLGLTRYLLRLPAVTALSREEVEHALTPAIRATLELVSSSAHAASTRRRISLGPRSLRDRKRTPSGTTMIKPATALDLAADVSIEVRYMGRQAP